MAETSPKPQPKKPKQSPRRPVPKADRLVWFERARAMHAYADAIKNADTKALKLFETVNEQVQHQFEFNVLLYTVSMGAAITILLVSLGILLFASNTNNYVQAFSLIGMPVSILALILLLYRNPVTQSRHLLDSVLKLNVVFLNFIRRLQHSDLLLQYVFYEDDKMEISKIYALIQDFQNTVDQTMDEIKQIGN